MSLQVEKLEKNMAKLTIEVPAEEFEKAVQAAYMKQRKSIAVPGFRKGKVPRQMIEKMYGAEIFFEEASNIILPEAYAKAYDESGLDIVSTPVIDIVQIGKCQSFIFTAEVAVKPEVTLGEYKGLKVDKISNRVTQKEIDAKLEEEQKKNARTVSVTDRAVAEGDDVVLDFEGFVDGVAFEGGKGENYTLTIGSGQFIPGFEEALVGAELETEVDVNVTFPAEYHSEELAGKPAVFKCTVHEIKVKELPELDDDFASEVSEFDTLDELKADIKAKIKETAVANATMEIPEAMLNTQVKQMYDEMAQRIQMQGLTMEQYFQFSGMTEDVMLEQIKPNAVKRIETRLVLEAIVKAENIEITEEKFEAEINKMAESYGMEASKLLSYMGAEEKEQMKKDMAVQEAVTFLLDNAVEE